MYFAIEPAQPDVPQKIIQALADLYETQSKTPRHLFALVDGVFDENLLAKRPWSREKQWSLYEGTDLQAFDKVAPHLLAAPADIAEQHGWLQEIFAACDGKPMLSILASTLDGSTLRQHFQPYVIARTEDLTEWPVRWGDTRVLPQILRALEPEQREQLLSPLYGWWSIQRDGSLIVWRGHSTTALVPATFDKLPLNDQAFALLVDQAEADAILANIWDTHPDLLRRYRPSKCHFRVAKHLVLATENGIQAANARQHFSMLALCLNQEFVQHPDMIALLKRTQQGANYAEEIKALPERFWQEMG